METVDAYNARKNNKGNIIVGTFEQELYTNK